jgi:hypothetical protein
MAASFHGKAARRAEITLDAIRDALAAGDPPCAISVVTDYAKSELKKVAEHRPADAAVFAAGLAATIYASARGFHDHKPVRREPDPVAVFDAVTAAQPPSPATFHYSRKEGRDGA